MRHEMHGSIGDNALLIQRMIDDEIENGIPGKGVESFKFEGSNVFDFNGRFVDKDDDRYIYLNRPDGFNVTIQRCMHGELTYYFVYIERELTDSSIGIPGGLVTGTQGTCHTFRWVRSLKHAMKLGEFGAELMLGLANPEEYFLTQDEWNNGKQN